MVNNKGQLKIQQMAFMLLAVTLFFVLVGMFVLVYKFAGLRESATLLEQENAMLLVTKIANSPEFSCGGSFATQRLKCIDFDKVMALKMGIGRYDDFWGVQNLEIRKVYPVSGNIECTPANYPDCGVIKLRSEDISGFVASNFVSLCRKELFEGDIENKCELARIMVSYESK